jgi:hypothetical protein
MNARPADDAPVAVEHEVTTAAPIPEAVRVLAEVTVPHLSPRGHLHLHLLLGAKRAFPGPAGTRRRRLCVFLDFMHAHRRRPKLPEYLDEYERRRSAGEDVPSLKQLYMWFGSYPKAVALAARYFDGGTGARAPSRAPTRRPRGSVTEEMLLDSVEALFDELGDWPDDADYAAILNAEVLLRSKLGVGDVDFFSISAFNDTFGSYGEGRQAAERRFAERARLREERAGLPAPHTPRNARPARRRTRSSNLRAPG